MKKEKRQYRCVDCGFLGEHWDVGFGEVKSQTRALLLSHEERTIRLLDCALGQWYEEDKSANSILNIPTEKQACKYFMIHQPGRNPDEHKEIQRDNENRNAMRKATLLGAGIGAAAAIVSNFIYYLIYGPK